MKLRELIKDKKILLENIDIKGLSEDSRSVKKGYIFFLKGCKNNSSNYIKEAINKGAKLIVYSKNNQDVTYKFKKKCFFYLVEDVESYMSLMARKFYKNNNSTKIYGITGTNGKTSISNYIAQLYNLKKEKCGVIGTLGNGIYPKLSNKGLTTPNTIYINKKIQEFKRKGVNTLSIEVSSHGITQRRIENIVFNTTIFSNLSHDHMDYHKSMRKYFEAKLKLFNAYKSKKQVICIDDYYGKKINNIIKKNRNVVTVSKNNKNANIYAANIKYQENGTSFNVNSKWGSYDVHTKLYGNFSITNILISIAAISETKKDFIFNIGMISKMKPLDGRMTKYFKKNYPITFVDFAHTPDAIEKVLYSIKKHYPEKNIITIFGCGGNRDKEKRSIMGKIAEKFSNEIIITNDNPRDEKPKLIYSDIVKGIKNKKKCKMILNRTKAISRSVCKKNINKIVLILGKGHEEFQIIGKNKEKFNDGCEVLKALKK
jgi:UDP-N-acetylmuramoyl-L-alanyl-D-glutamate--2,6-diaminopimelate ligase